MKTKIVYTLVSGGNDIYLAQVAISSYTVKYYNPSAHVILVVDVQTSEYIKNKNGLLNEIDDVVIVNVPNDLTNKQRSRYLKTTLRHHIKGDYLFIDTDTVVAEDLSKIDYEKSKIAAVLDRNIDVNRNSMRKFIENDIKSMDLTLDNLKSKYFNSGVLFIRDVPESYDFYNKWYEYWNKVRDIDQPAFAKANMECGYLVQELDGTWNCQLVENFINYLSEGKILHYFASGHQSSYLLYDNEFMNNILREGCLSEDIKHMLEKPRSLFQDKHLLVYGGDVDFFRTYMQRIYRYHRWLFNILEYISRVIVTKRLF